MTNATTGSGVSLRQAARELHYSPSSLHQAKGEGHFSALPDGSYDPKEVARGLLANSSPNAEHRAHLERLISDDDAPQRSQRSPQTRFDARTERAIAASVQLSRAPEVLDAIDLLAHLARAKTQAFHAISPLRDPVGAVAVFRDAVVAMLDERIKQIDEVADDEPDDDLVAAVAATSDRNSAD